MLARPSPFAVVIALLAISGCGGSKTGSTNAAGSGAGASSLRTSRAPAASGSASTAGATQIDAQAEAICARANRELSAENDVVKYPRDIVRVAPRRAKLVRAATQQLSKLTPPSAMAGEYQQFLADRTNLANGMVTLGAQTAAHNITGARAAYAETTKASAEIASFAQRHGLTACAKIG